MTSPTVDRAPRGRSLPQVVERGPRTAAVLRFHRPAPQPTAASSRAAGTPTEGTRAAAARRAGTRTGGTQTAGSSALAPAPQHAEAADRRLNAVRPPNEAEDVRKLAAAITLAAMEVLAGTRPITQLSPWLHRDLLAPVQLRAELRRAAGAASSARAPRLAMVHRAPAVKSAHASLVEPGVYEAAVIVSDAARCRAVALRVEASGRTWQVTALEIG